MHEAAMSAALVSAVEAEQRRRAEREADPDAYIDWLRPDVVGGLTVREGRYAVSRGNFVAYCRDVVTARREAVRLAKMAGGRAVSRVKK